MSCLGANLVYMVVIVHVCAAQSELFLPPMISSPKSAATYYIKNLVDFSTSCNASGTGPIKYTWTRDGVVINSDGVFVVDEVTGDLTVTSFTTREDGKYQCRAENYYPSDSTIRPVAMSQVITLLQMQNGGNWDVAEEAVSETEGSYVGLQCTGAPETVPKATFSWFKDEASGTSQVITNDRIFIDNEGTLHFIYLETTDQLQGNNDVYKCSIYNSQTGNEIKLGSPKKLTVSALPSGIAKPSTKPQIKYKTSNVKFERKQTAELECVFSGYPVPFVSWENARREVIDPNNNKDRYELSGNGRKLMITNLTEFDEGAFTCIGDNNVGRAEITVMLDVTSGPIWKTGLSNQTLPVGKDAVFTCIADPPQGETRLPDPVWYKNGEIINEQTGKLEFSDRSRVLTVRVLQKPGDIMCFQCNVSNDNGYEFADACLNVIEAITLTKEPSNYQEVDKGDNVDLTVAATTDPAFTLSYLWRFKNVTYDLNPPPHVVYDDVTKTAYINTSKLTDEEFESIQGTYYRILYHRFDRIEVPVTVTTKAVAPPVVAAAGFPWWVIVIVILLILLIVVIILILCCCRNKEQGAYRIYKTELNTAYLDPDQDIEESKFKDVARIEADDIDMVKVPLRDDSEV